MELTYIEHTSHMLMFSLQTKVKVPAEYRCSSLFGKVHTRIQEARDYLKLYHSFIDYWTLKNLFMFRLGPAFLGFKPTYIVLMQFPFGDIFLATKVDHPEWLVEVVFWDDLLKFLKLEGLFINEVLIIIELLLGVIH